MAPNTAFVGNNFGLHLTILCLRGTEKTDMSCSPFSLIHRKEVICRIICILDTDLKSKQKRSLEIDVGHIWLPWVNQNLAWLLEMHCGFFPLSLTRFFNSSFLVINEFIWTELAEFTLESPCCAAKHYSCTMFGSSNCKIIGAIIVW